MDLEPLLNEFDVAKSLGLSVATVRRWRVNGGGPVFLKIGASVRYRAADLTSYVASRVVDVQPKKESPVEQMVRVREENRLK